MTDYELQTIVTGGTFFEGPRWHDGRWWVSDFYRQLVVAIDEDGSNVEEVSEVPGQPSGLEWLPDGSMVIVSMTDHPLLHRHPDGTVTVAAEGLEFQPDGALTDRRVWAQAPISHPADLCRTQLPGRRAGRHPRRRPVDDPR